MNRGYIVFGMVLVILLSTQYMIGLKEGVNTSEVKYIEKINELIIKNKVLKVKTDTVIMEKDRLYAAAQSNIAHLESIVIISERRIKSVTKTNEELREIVRQTNELLNLSIKMGVRNEKI